MITGKYPSLRLRRSRKFSWSRRLVRENDLSTNDLILPIFLTEGKNKKIEISKMPGIFKYSVDMLPKVIDKALLNKIPMIAFFPNTLSNIAMDSASPTCPNPVPPTVAACLSASANELAASPTSVLLPKLAVDVTPENDCSPVCIASFIVVNK